MFLTVILILWLFIALCDLAGWGFVDELWRLSFGLMFVWMMVHMVRSFFLWPWLRKPDTETPDTKHLRGSGKRAGLFCAVVIVFFITLPAVFRGSPAHLYAAFLCIVLFLFGMFRAVHLRDKLDQLSSDQGSVSASISAP